MKRENIKVGEYVVYKPDNKIFCIASPMQKVPTPPFVWERDVIEKREDYRKPRISDLSEGDVFEWEGKPFEILNRTRKNKAMTCDKATGIKVRWLKLTTKVKIISLASEKKEPEKRSTTVWANCYPDGLIRTSDTRFIADRMASKDREACIPVTIEWTVGEGLEDD